MKKTVQLTPDVGYYVVRSGQTSPCRGNGVMVYSSIFIRADADGYIPPDLQFGDRAVLCGERLGKNWGDESEGGVRVRLARVATKPTWAEAFETAEAAAIAQAQKLVDAIAARRQALIDAGD